MKDQLADAPTIAKVANRLPPPVRIRRKQIPPIEERQQDSSVADSSVSDEGARSGREESSETSKSRRRDRGRSRRSEPRHEEKSARGEFEFSLENEENRAQSEVAGGRSYEKWSSYHLPRSASTNNTARIFAESADGGTTSVTSSSSYERDLRSLLCGRPCENSAGSERRREAGTSVSTGRFITRISGSTSSDLQEESELSSEEKDALIEGVRTPSNVCRNRIPKFGTRRRIVATSGSSVVKDYYHKPASDRLLNLTEDPCCVSVTSKPPQHNVHVINETTYVINETDTFPGDPGTSQKPTSAPTTLSLGRKLTSWTKEGKDLLVKSVSSANTLAPTTMTCIKSPRTMSEHLLGQLEVPVPPTTAVLGALRVKGGSLREGERNERVTDVPRQRWSSVRVKGGSTKSLLLENGGPQPPIKSAGFRKEVYFSAFEQLTTTLIKIPLINHDLLLSSIFKSDHARDNNIIVSRIIFPSSV